MNKGVKEMATHQQRVTAVLARLGPMTTMQIATALKVKRNNIKFAVTLAKRDGDIHVSGWTPVGGLSLVPVYSVGSGEQAARPPREEKIVLRSNPDRIAAMIPPGPYKTKWVEVRV
jgi:hypothetical protein